MKERARRKIRRIERRSRRRISLLFLRSFPLLSALSRASRDEKAGRFGSREWIIINRYFRQSRPFILRHATPIIYRRFGRWREGERSKYKWSEGEGKRERRMHFVKGGKRGEGKKTNRDRLARLFCAILFSSLHSVALLQIARNARA